MTGNISGFVELYFLMCLRLIPFSTATMCVLLK